MKLQSALVLWATLALTVTTGCISQKHVARTPAAKLVQGAERYTSQLKAQGQLPGYSGSEHGRVIACAPWQNGNVSYPASVSVRAWKEGDDSTYCYTVVKDAPESPWRLSQATRLDKQDKVIESLFPK